MSNEALEQAKQIDEIRIRIHRQFPEFTFPNPVLEPIFFGRFDKTPVEDRKLIMDADTGVQWDVVSDRYDMIPHEIIVDNMLKSIPQEFGSPETKLRTWSQGACFRVEILFPDLDNKDTEIRKGDKVRPRIVGYSSYNRSTHYGIEAGAEQLICSNGLVAFVAEEEKKRRHIMSIHSEADKVSMGDSIAIFLENFSEQTDLWKTWAETKLSLTDLEEVCIALPFSEKERESMLDLPLLSHDKKHLRQLGKEATLWDVNSAATQMARHVIKSEKRAVELESQIAKVLYSRNSK